MGKSNLSQANRGILDIDRNFVAENFHRLYPVMTRTCAWRAKGLDSC
jgi:hypothetical protein